MWQRVPCLRLHPCVPRGSCLVPPSLGQRLQGHVLSAKSLWGFTHSFVPAHHPPCFLLGCQQCIVLPPSATRATNITMPVPVFPQWLKTIKYPWVAAAHGSQSPQPPFLCGAQASHRRARAVLCFSLWQPHCPHWIPEFIHASVLFSRYWLSASDIPGMGVFSTLWKQACGLIPWHRCRGEIRTVGNATERGPHERGNWLCKIPWSSNLES